VSGSAPPQPPLSPLAPGGTRSGPSPQAQLIAGSASASRHPGSQLPAGGHLLRHSSTLSHARGAAKPCVHSAGGCHAIGMPRTLRAVAWNRCNALQLGLHCFQVDTPVTWVPHVADTPTCRCLDTRARLPRGRDTVGRYGHAADTPITAVTRRAHNVSIPECTCKDYKVAFCLSKTSSCTNESLQTSEPFSILLECPLSAWVHTCNVNA
jgi:hypothetical protein